MEEQLKLLVLAAKGQQYLLQDREDDNGYWLASYVDSVVADLESALENWQDLQKALVGL